MYTASGLQCNTIYTFTVKARNQQQLESPGAAAAGKTGACEQPVTILAPIDPQISADQNSVNIINNNVLLNLSAKNSPTKMMLSDKANFSGAAWQNFVPSKYWNFNHTFVGTGYVYAKFKNSAGESSSVYDTFTVTRSAPSINNPPVNPPNPNNPVHNPQNNLTFSTPSSTTNISSPQQPPANSKNTLVVPPQTIHSVILGLIALVWLATILLICFVLYWAMVKNRRKDNI